MQVTYSLPKECSCKLPSLTMVIINLQSFITKSQIRRNMFFVFYLLSRTTHNFWQMVSVSIKIPSGNKLLPLSVLFHTIMCNGPSHISKSKPLQLNCLLAHYIVKHATLRILELFHQLFCITFECHFWTVGFIC